MSFSRPTLQALRDRIKSDLETRMNIGVALRRSFVNVWAKTQAMVCHSLYGYLVRQSKQLFVLQADTDGLNEIGAEYRILREAATYASGNVTVTGTIGTTIPGGTQLRRPSDGRIYETNEDVTLGSASEDIGITAKVAGEDGNEIAGVTLYFVSPVSGISSTAIVASGGLINGEDEESDEDYRARILARKQQPPHGGAGFDYAKWAKEIPDLDVTRAWNHDQYYGIGTVGVSFVLDNQETTIIPTSTQCTLVRDYILEHVDPISGVYVGSPVGQQHGIFVFPPTPITVDFVINIYPNTSAVQSAVEAVLDDFIKREGGPSQTLYLSRISEAISLALGEGRHQLLVPNEDVSAGSTEVQVLGNITWGTY